MKLTNLVTVSTHFFIQLTKWIGLTDLDEIHDIMEETSAGGFLIKKSVVKAKTQFKGRLKIERSIAKEISNGIATSVSGKSGHVKSKSIIKNSNLFETKFYRISHWRTP